MTFLIFDDIDGRRCKYKIDSYDKIEDVHLAIARGTGVVKFVCGCCNNAAYNLLKDANDQLKKHPAYIANLRNAHYYYNCAFNEWTKYEKGLLRSAFTFFHLDDMTPEIRKRYGNISDKEYYEFWAGQGAPIYTKSRPMVTSLWNKYRLALEHHGIPDADALAWGMTAMSGIEQACGLWDAAVKDISENFHLPMLMVERIFRPFRLTRLRVAWYRALKATDPFVGIDEPFDEQERHNIELGIEQLCRAWCDPKKMYDSLLDTVQDFEEIFRTKGEMKKSIKELTDMKQLT